MGQGCPVDQSYHIVSSMGENTVRLLALCNSRISPVLF